MEFSKLISTIGFGLISFLLTFLFFILRIELLKIILKKIDEYEGKEFTVSNYDILKFHVSFIRGLKAIDSIIYALMVFSYVYWISQYIEIYTGLLSAIFLLPILFNISVLGLLNFGFLEEETFNVMSLVSVYKLYIITFIEIFKESSERGLKIRMYFGLLLLSTFVFSLAYVVDHPEILIKLIEGI